MWCKSKFHPSAEKNGSTVSHINDDALSANTNSSNTYHQATGVMQISKHNSGFECLAIETHFSHKSLIALD